MPWFGIPATTPAPIILPETSTTVPIGFIAASAAKRAAPHPEEIMAIHKLKKISFIIFSFFNKKIIHKNKNKSIRLLKIYWKLFLLLCIEKMEKKMSEKIYLNDIQDLTKSSQAGEKVFIEYGDKIEEIEEANQYGYSDWEFTVKVLTNMAKVNFFKVIK